jgi:mannose-6-phosphate isomerase-like protein (cupin superfamily)
VQGPNRVLRPAVRRGFLAVVSGRRRITKRHEQVVFAGNFSVSIPPTTSHLPLPRVASLGELF